MSPAARRSRWTKRFASNADKVRHRAVLVPLLAEPMRRRKADWLAALEAAQVPCGPINDLAEVFADLQVRARGMTVDLPHPLPITCARSSPMKFSATPSAGTGSHHSAAARHRQVLREAGLAWRGDRRTARRQRAVNLP